MGAYRRITEPLDATPSTAKHAGAAMSRKPTVYRLERIEDLASIPLDRLEACLRDVQYVINLFKIGVGDNPHGVKMGAVIWTDDDNHSVDLTLNGEQFLSLSVTKAEERPE